MVQIRSPEKRTPFDSVCLIPSAVSVRNSPGSVSGFNFRFPANNGTNVTTVLGQFPIAAYCVEKLEILEPLIFFSLNDNDLECLD